MKKYLLFFLFITLHFFAQDYSVQSIPEELKKDAYIVIRDQSSIYNINSVSDVEIREQKTWTILGKEGDGYSTVVIPYSKSSKVSDIGVSVFNAAGKEIKKYSKKDFSDYSHTPSFGLYTDDRILVLKINSTEYPFTIKTSYVVNTINSVFINDFSPVNDFHISVQNTTTRFNNNSGIKLRTKITNTDLGKVTATESDLVSDYRFTNFPAIREEKFSPSIEYLVPRVEYSLDTFMLEGKQGKLTSWDDFGKWYYQNLLTPATIITPEIKNEVAALNLTGTTDEKVRKIYHYMQDKTRYVLVALGIGGWMPMNADEVRKKGYGDCKALTNYMRAMLDAANIPSYYAVIKSDPSPKKFDADFPKMGGNHVILMVPDGDKNIWLENTSQKIAYNHLGNSTTNRNVVAVTDNGISIINTPVYPANQSLEIIKSKIKINEDNSIDVSSDLKYTGGQYDFQMPLVGLSSKEIMDALKSRYSNLKFSKLDIQNFNNNRDVAEITYNMNFNAADYSKKLGNDIFLRVVPFYDFDLNTSDSERTLPFETSFAFQDDYEMIFEAPAGFVFTEIPQPAEINSEFGSYKISYNLSDNKLTVQRILTINKGIYPKEKFKSYLDFRRKTINSDNTKVLLTKK